MKLLNFIGTSIVKPKKEALMSVLFVSNHLI